MASVNDRIATPEASHQLTPEQSKRLARVQVLLDEWMADESGYDEETWPLLEKALREDTLTFRTPTFDE